MKRILFVLFCTLACFNVFAGDPTPINLDSIEVSDVCRSGDGSDREYVWWRIDGIHYINDSSFQSKVVTDETICKESDCREGLCAEGCIGKYEDTDLILCWAKDSNCGDMMRLVLGSNYDFKKYGDTGASYTHKNVFATYPEPMNATLYAEYTEYWRDNGDNVCLHNTKSEPTYSCSEGYKLDYDTYGNPTCTKKKTCSDYQTQETSKVWEWPADKTNYASYKEPETSQHIDAHYEGNPADETYVPTSCYLPHGGDAKRYFDDKGIFHFNTTCQWHSTF